MPRLELILLHSASANGYNARRLSSARRRSRPMWSGLNMWMTASTWWASSANRAASCLLARMWLRPAAPDRAVARGARQRSRMREPVSTPEPAPAEAGGLPSLAQDFVNPSPEALGPAFRPAGWQDALCCRSRGCLDFRSRGRTRLACACARRSQNPRSGCIPDQRHHSERHRSHERRFVNSSVAVTRVPEREVLAREHTLISIEHSVRWCVAHLPR